MPEQAAKAKKKSAQALAKPRKKRGYHHGDLKAALVEAAEQLLLKEGVAGLKLRAITRVVGVSHTAGDSHFGDLTGLLSELAAVGFERLTSAMLAGDGTPDSVGEGYVRFALANREMFLLMFRNDLLNFEWPRLRAALDRAGLSLARAVGDQAGAMTGLSAEQCARMARAWGVVHGLALLGIGGSLNGILRRATAPALSLEGLVAAALRD